VEAAPDTVAGSKSQVTDLNAAYGYWVYYPMEIVPTGTEYSIECLNIFDQTRHALSSFSQQQTRPKKPPKII
jgi:hypothetical protein